MNALDPKFAKILALMRSTQHTGEQASARARAVAVAAAAGITFDEAAAFVDAPAPPQSFFDGLDDHMEKQEPGWKAKRAAERSEKERARVARRAAILAHYGSEEAALAPCPREVMLRTALGRWRKPCEPPWQRWTSSVEGYDFFKPLRPDLRMAVTQAYPMPTTFTDAMAEYDYWSTRRKNLEDVRGPGTFGDSGLDLVADIRLDLIRDLVEHEIETKTIVELYARFVFYHEMESHCDKVEAALFRDLGAILQTPHLSNVSVNTPQPDPCTADRNGQIRAALDADSSRSDRDIARACGCSPTTVGKVRRAMGLHDIVRSVHRGGQTFQMNFSFEDRG